VPARGPTRQLRTFISDCKGYGPKKAPSALRTWGSHKIFLRIAACDHTCEALRSVHWGISTYVIANRSAPAPRCWRQAVLAPKRSAERRIGLVAYILGDPRQRRVAAAQ
jgi:hypothetical protein